jgi:hypothetical protein
MNIKVHYSGKHALPQFETTQSAGMDLRANIDAPVVLQPGDRALIPTGIKMALPDGYEAQIRPRSGLAYKHGITVLNSPGTIDADYPRTGSVHCGRWHARGADGRGTVFAIRVGICGRSRRDGARCRRLWQYWKTINPNFL